MRQEFAPQLCVRPAHAYHAPGIGFILVSCDHHCGRSQLVVLRSATVAGTTLKTPQLAWLLLSTLVLCCRAEATTTLHAVVAAPAPTIDGQIGAEEWPKAQAIAAFVQVEPQLDGTPSEPSTLYVLRDHSFLYIALDLPQSSKLIAREWVQDADLSGDDFISVQLDPFASKEKGYVFSVNPNGARSEALVSDGDDFDEDWEDLWYAAAGPSESGWQVEMAIPFRSLSFPSDVDRWRINVIRQIAERNEVVALTSRKRRLDLSATVDLTGMAGADAGSGLSLTASSTFSSTRDYRSGRRSSELKPSADLFYKLTPSLTAAVTINTDFSAAEVDQRELNLTRFELFFPERRDFFLRDANVFAFAGLEENGLPYFSRRIGLGLEGLPLDIRGGAKLTGQVDRFSLGIMAVNQDIELGSSQRTLGVARVRAGLNETNSIGMIATYGDPLTGASDRLYGVDYRYANSEVWEDYELELFAWWQQVDLARKFHESSTAAADDEAYGFSIEWPNETIEALLSYAHIGADFAPPLGFVNRAGISDWRSEFSYQFRPELSWLRTINVGVDSQWVEDVDGRLESRLHEFSLLELGGAAGDELELLWISGYERFVEPFEITDDLEIAPGSYHFDRWAVEFESAAQRDLQVALRLENGPFLGGRLRSVEGALVVRPSARLSLGLEYESDRLDFDGERQTLRLARLSTRYSFNSAWSLSSLLQYDNESDEIGLNARLRWVPRAGQEHFLVVNYGRARDEDLGRYRSETFQTALRLSFSFLF